MYHITTLILNSTICFYFFMTLSDFYWNFPYFYFKYVLLYTFNLKLRNCSLQLRKNGEKLEELLSERAVQFRAIQRRLLTRFKDKTPAPLQHLDTLLDGTHQQASTMPGVVPPPRSVDFENQVCFFRVSFPRGKKNSYYVNLHNCTDNTFAAGNAHGYLKSL